MRTVYLTGIAATGKTSLASAVKARVETVEVIGYSSLLREYLSQARGASIQLSQMRQQSSRLITPDDIAAVDRLLVELVSRARKDDRHVIIDSHAVTAEDYGFRVTPFSLSLLTELRIDMLVCLYADPQEILRRSKNKADGTVVLDSQSISYALGLQSSLVLAYGLLTNTPSYFLNTSNGIEMLADWMASRLTGSTKHGSG